MDEKSRLRMPTSFKKLLGKNYIVTKGTSKSLFVFSASSAKELLADKLKDTSLFDSKPQKATRLLFSSAFEVEEDNQGRVLLPKALREFASLTKDVIFIGVGNHIEIWDEKAWDNYQNEGDDFDKVLEGLSDYGI